MDIRLLPQQQLKVTPKQIAANYILQLSSMELQEVVNQELEENPALDLEEVQVCPLCGAELTGRVCLRCFGTGIKGGQSTYTQDNEPLEGASLTQRDEDDEEFDPIARAEAEQTLGEYLSWNVRVLIPRRLQTVAEHIIGNLNEFGYLETSDGREVYFHRNAVVGDGPLEAGAEVRFTEEAGEKGPQASSVVSLGGRNRV